MKHSTMWSELYGGVVQAGSEQRRTERGEEEVLKSDVTYEMRSIREAGLCLEDSRVPR